jgi:hypothetical protein
MRYNASHGGHAPGHLRDALIEALEFSWADDLPWWNLLEIDFFDPNRKAAWARADAQTRAIWLLGQLWNCTDIVPGDFCMTVGIPCGSSYAILARELKAELRQFECNSGALDSVSAEEGQ